MASHAPSLRGKLESVVGKLGRADHHLRDLERSLKRFRDKYPYAVNLDELYRRPGPGIPQPLPGQRTPLGQQLYAEVYKYVDQPVFLELKPGFSVPTFQWGLLIGDAVHNLSSALDNLAWAASADRLAQIHYRATPDGEKARENNERSVHFPICVDESVWPNTRQSALKYADPSLWAFFEKYQPFTARKERGEDPRRHPFYLIRELWNWDKHRFVHTAAATASLIAVSARLLNVSPDPVEVAADVVEVFRDRPIEGKTQAGTIRVHFPKPITGPTSLDMHVDCDFTLGILFGEASPLPFASVNDTLVRARNLLGAMINDAP
jgi:hypothetical protein